MRTLQLTSPLMHGPDVKSAQGRLEHNPFGNFEPGRIDGQFGDQAAGACVRAKYKIGYPVRDCTRTYGDALDAFLTAKATPSLAMRIRAKMRAAAADRTQKKLDAFYTTALSQLGTREFPSGSNKVKYSVWYGVIGPWCAMFQSWVCSQTGIPFHYAYVPDIVSDARRGVNGLSVGSGPAVGFLTLACFDWPGVSPGTADHVGAAIPELTLRRLDDTALYDAIKAYGPLSLGEFWSIEGNTSNGNNSNGGEVMLRKRPRSSVQAFVRVKI